MWRDKQFAFKKKKKNSSYLTYHFFFCILNSHSYNNQAFETPIILGNIFTWPW